MKKLLLTPFLFSMLQITAQINEDKNTFAVLSFNLGYAGNKINAPVSGLSIGMRTGNVYVSANTIIPVSSNSLAPKIVNTSLGFNIGSIQPFLSYSYIFVGKATEQYFRHTADEFINGWHSGGGISYHLKTIPLKFTIERQGKQTIFSTSLYKSF